MQTARLPLSLEAQRVLRTLMITLFCMLLALSVYFVIKMTKTAEIGHLIRENDFMRKDLEAENRILKQRVLDSQSLQTIQAETQNLGKPAGAQFVHPRRPLSSKELRKQ